MYKKSIDNSEEVIFHTGEFSEMISIVSLGEITVLKMYLCAF